MKVSFYANAMMVLPIVRRVLASGSQDLVSRASGRVALAPIVTPSFSVVNRTSGAVSFAASYERTYHVGERASTRVELAAAILAAASVESRAVGRANGAQVATRDVTLVFNVGTFAATELDWGVKSGATIRGETYLVVPSGIKRLVEGVSAVDVVTAPVRFGRAVVLGDVYVDMAGVGSELHVSSDSGDVAYRLLTDAVVSSYPCRTGGLKVTRVGLGVVCAALSSLESVTVYPIALTRGGRHK